VVQFNRVAKCNQLYGMYRIGVRNGNVEVGELIFVIYPRRNLDGWLLYHNLNKYNYWSAGLRD
jgi:hypothetical protein